MGRHDRRRSDHGDTKGNFRDDKSGLGKGEGIMVAFMWVLVIILCFGLLIALEVIEEKWR